MQPASAADAAAAWHDRANISKLISTVKKIKPMDRIGMGYERGPDGRIRFCLEHKKTGCSVTKLQKKWNNLRQILTRELPDNQDVREDQHYDYNNFLCGACGVWAVKIKMKQHRKKCVSNPDCKGVLAAKKTIRKKPRAAAAAAAIPQQQQVVYPLHDAAGRGHTEAVKLLLAAKASVDAPNKNGSARCR